MEFRRSSLVKSLVAALGSTIVLGSSSFARADAVFIVNPASKASRIDVDTARRLWLGKETELRDVGAVLPLDVDESSGARDLFLEKVLNKSAEDLRQYWCRLMFTGKATPPQSVGGDRAVVDWVAKDKQAIGFVERSAVTGAVKVIGAVK